MRDREIEGAIQAVKKVLGFNSKYNGRVILLFSGGRDSTIVANAFCAAYPQAELHLLFIDNGMLSGIKEPYEQFLMIKKLFPNNKIFFVEKEVKELMNYTVIREIENDFIKNHFSTLLVCVGCKLVMTHIAIQYARSIDSYIVLDGFSGSQKEYPEQTKTFMEERNRLWKHLGVSCISPLYDYLDQKEKTVRVLNSFGIEKKREAKCMFSNSFSKADEEEIALYMKKTDILLNEYKS